MDRAILGLSVTKRLIICLAVVAVSCDGGDDDESSGSGSSGSSTTNSTTTSTTDGSTGDPATSSGTDPSTTSGGSSSGGGDVDSAVLALCQCLLINCHDPYHLEYGSSDAEAAMACQADGGSIPLEAEGDSVQCRLSACEMSDCEAGLGMAAPCM